MYYSSGNYEAFATPKKPEGIENKSAYVVGTGLAGLAAACFLIRDAQMPGEHITLFEHLPVAGGSCDGIYDATKGFIMRGGREMDNHFECMWDLFKSIPSIVNPGETVFSEYYYLNKEDPNFSLCRVTEKQGQDAHTDRKYGLTPGAATQLLKLFMATNKSLEDKKVAKKIEYTQGGVEKVIELTENDLVICTNGCQGDASAYGDNTHAPVVKVKNGEGPSVEMWKKLAAQDPAFGHPEKFFKDIKETSWESWTVDTANKQILDAIQKICKRDPLSGKVVTGGIVTCRDSSWLISWTINRQGQFQEQPKDHCLIWVYGLNCWDDKGDFIKKNMCDCTGIELAAEWLYHIGIPEDQIMDLATNECNTTPCMMPYVTTFFEPRAEGDRPKVVPDGSVNLAFVGQFADTPRDTVFTTEYSIRTAMEAVYTLCNVDRGVPEVWGSVYDIRDLLYATSKLLDGKKPLEFLLPSVLPLLDLVKEPLVNNVVVDLLKKYNIV